jgi:hypothetical protein
MEQNVQNDLYNEAYRWMYRIRCIERVYVKNIKKSYKKRDKAKWTGKD